jgi:DNA polymerase-4
MSLRKIIHIDMDYFYAQVEELGSPSLKNKPFAVGGGSKRGVICTCNYIARKFGVRSAMPGFIARELCPDITFIKPRFHLYKEKSDLIFNIFKKYTSLIEGISLDEAYLDVTDTDLCHNSATLIAKEIRNEIFETTGLTASAGVSFNKLLSKIASEINKPNALNVITPDKASEVIADMPLSKINGVGKVTFDKLKKHNLNTFKDVRHFPTVELEKLVGNYAPKLKNYVHGIDHRKVQASRERKSLSVEHTLYEHIFNINDLKSHIENVYEEFESRFSSYDDKKVKTIFLKLKYDDFSKTSIERKPKEVIDVTSFYDLMEEKENLFRNKIRLVGLGVRFDSEAKRDQLSFPDV